MFVGMDVHRNRTQVCVLDRKGNEVRNRNVTNDRQALRKELAGVRRARPSPLRPPTAPDGSRSCWATSASRPTWPIRPDVEPHRRRQTEERSGRRPGTLANLLRTGYLAEARLAPKEVREQRLLLRERARLGAHPHHGQEPDPGSDRR